MRNKKIALAMTLVALAGFIYQAMPITIEVESTMAEEPEDKESYRLHGVDAPTIYRNLAYDAGLSDPERVIGVLGSAPPISAEGAEKMRQDSDQRLSALFPVASLLEAQAMFGAAAFVEESGAEMDDEDKAEMFATYHAYGKSLLFGALAGLQAYMEEAHAQ